MTTTKPTTSLTNSPLWPLVLVLAEIATRVTPCQEERDNGERAAASLAAAREEAT